MPSTVASLTPTEFASLTPAKLEEIYRDLSEEQLEALSDYDWRATSLRLPACRHDCIFPGMALPRVQPIRPIWRKEPFDAPDWLFDLKYGGFRGVCYIEPDGCRMLSLNGKTFAGFETLARRVATERRWPR